MADILSNMLYHGYDSKERKLSPDKLSEHRKRVNIDEETILRMIRDRKK